MKILKAFIVFLLWNLFAYGYFAFVQLELNPLNWGNPERAFFPIFGIIIGAVITCAVYDLYLKGATK
jgi:hypothetical protein